MVRWIKRLSLLLVIVLIVGGAGAWWAYSRLIEPYRGYQDAEVFVDIPAGSGPNAIGDRLVSSGIVRDAMTFRAALLVSGRARSLKAGRST
jgi:cell division protein YceG involved in septum cleavage